MVCWPSASNLVPRYGMPKFDCGGAAVRSHLRHLGMVVTIDGDIDADNVDQLTAYTQRFALAKERIVLDLSNVNYFAADAVSFLRAIADGCSAEGVEWVLVASAPVLNQLREFYDAATVPVANSVAEALHRFADVLDARREVLLPLVKKTA